MKNFFLAAAIGLGIFTVVTAFADTHVVNAPARTIVSDTDTTQVPVPDSLSLSFVQ
jgi:hypothetical protein